MVASRPPKRGEVFLVVLDPTRGSEIRKTRPCVVVSPDELNAYLRTVIVAPLTTGGQKYPFRVPCRFAGKSGEVVADQLRPSTTSVWFAIFDAFRQQRLRRFSAPFKRCSRRDELHLPTPIGQARFITGFLPLLGTLR